MRTPLAGVRGRDRRVRNPDPLIGRVDAISPELVAAGGELDHPGDRRLGRPPVSGWWRVQARRRVVARWRGVDHRGRHDDGRGHDQRGPHEDREGGAVNEATMMVVMVEAPGASEIAPEFAAATVGSRRSGCCEAQCDHQRDAQHPHMVRPLRGLHRRRQVTIASVSQARPCQSGVVEVCVDIPVRYRLGFFDASHVWSRICHWPPRGETA